MKYIVFSDVIASLFRAAQTSTPRQPQQQQPVVARSSAVKNEAVHQYSDLGHRAVSEIQGELLKVTGDSTTIQIFICSVMMVGNHKNTLGLRLVIKM